MEPTISENQQLIDTLLLNASFIDNLGLLHGKMGISILFYQLARKTSNKIYEDYAGELIDEIYDEITINTPVDFVNGLAGIGWGIEYLVQNGFIEADTDDVLEEFDKKIFNELQQNDSKLQTDLKKFLGFYAYFSIRNKEITKGTFSIVSSARKLLSNQLENLILVELRNGIEKTVSSLANENPLTINDVTELVSFIPDIHQPQII